VLFQIVPTKKPAVSGGVHFYEVASLCAQRRLTSLKVGDLDREFCDFELHYGKVKLTFGYIIPFVTPAIISYG
jgi:hypothetical protein